MYLSKNELKSPSRFRRKFVAYINMLNKEVFEKYGIRFSEEELGDLILSACRSNDFNVLEEVYGKLKMKDENVREWIEKKLIPNTIILSLDDADIIRLLLFCIEITYEMFSGGTRATITQKGFRERRRAFETILVDQFVGKIGEVFVKKFLEANFNAKVELDWEISPEIERFRNDILNASENVSIKSSQTLAGIWAEADKGYDYGVTVKCSVPRHPILQFFIETCGFSNLLKFAENKIPRSDRIFTEYIERIRNRINEYVCDRFKTEVKGFICGYFRTSDYTPVRKGEKLPYLEEVKEERYIVPINELKWEKKDWQEFVTSLRLY